MTATTTRALPIWFLAAWLPMIVSQLLRLRQVQPETWLLCDYAGRLGTIAVLAAIPVARRIAFARPAPTMDAGRIFIWIVVVWLATIFGIDVVKRILVYELPLRPLGIYPRLDGWLRDFDLADPVVSAKLRERYGNRLPLDEVVIAPSAVFDSPLLTEVGRH